MCIGLLFLLFLSATSTPQTPTSEPGSGSSITTEGEDEEYHEKKCSYQDVLNYLNLTKSNDIYVMTRPVKHHETKTEVYLDVMLSAILDVVEKDQRVTACITVQTYWTNQHIFWELYEFCGIHQISVPAEVLWTPDIAIAEIIEKDKASPNPYITIYSDGVITFKNDLVMGTTCRMQIYSFPFDIQTCNLTFSSSTYTAEELQLRPLSTNSELTTSWSREAIRTQDEWILINMTVIPVNATESAMEADKIIYMITIKRRPVLYVVNFLLPVLFFLCLDLASFFISDTGGEKLGFKVTVLLAVTVLQLILNEILPSTSNTIPLIVTFCIVIFALMLLSLLETILVIHLIAKDSAPQENEADTDRSLSEDTEENKWTCCTCLCNASGRDTSPELLSMDKEQGSCSKLTGESHSLEMISEELRELQKSLTVILSSKDEEMKPGYWTRVAKRINRAFFIFYVTTVCLFLVGIFVKWNNSYYNDEKA